MFCSLTIPAPLGVRLPAQAQGWRGGCTWRGSFIIQFLGSNYSCTILSRLLSSVAACRERGRHGGRAAKGTVRCPSTGVRLWEQVASPRLTSLPHDSLWVVLVPFLKGEGKGWLYSELLIFSRSTEMLKKMPVIQFCAESGH